MNKLSFTIGLLLLLPAILNAQTDWTHSKVKQRNIINNYITKDGKIVYQATNNDSLRKATYYEYFNSTLFATTDYVLNENGRYVYITFRIDTKNNNLTQIVETQSNSSPSISSMTIAVNERKQLVNNGVVSNVYRRSNFIDLLDLKTIRGKLLMKN